MVLKYFIDFLFVIVKFMSFQEIDSGIFLVRLPMADKKNARFTQKNIHTIIAFNIIII